MPPASHSSDRCSPRRPPASRSSGRVADLVPRVIRSPGADTRVRTEDLLYANLATLTRNRVVPAGSDERAVFEILSQPTPLQARAFELLGVSPGSMQSERRSLTGPIHIQICPNRAGSSVWSTSGCVFSFTLPGIALSPRFRDRHRLTAPTWAC